MLKEKEYQMKDIMERFGITRDTIRYYESQGLIHSQRKGNGYRVFDEVNRRKLKKILAFRNMGMTVEEIQQHLQCETQEERMEIISKLRNRTEQEILELNKKLKKIHEWEQSVCENSRFDAGFNAGYNLTLCVDCPHVTVEDRQDFLLVNALEAELKPMEGLSNVRECELVKNSDLGREVCMDCPKRRVYKKYYRCRVRDINDKEQLNHLLKQQCHNLNIRGERMDEHMYILRKVIHEQGRDRMILDIYLPVRD